MNLEAELSSVKVRLETALHKLDSNWLQQTSFEEKCRFWTNFLHDTKVRIDQIPNGSYDAWKAHLAELQLVSSEMSSKQQLMQSILVDGRKLCANPSNNPQSVAATEHIKNKMEDFKLTWKSLSAELDERIAEASDVSFHPRLMLLNGS